MLVFPEQTATAKLGDFGLATWAETGHRFREPVGTKHYWAPEMWLGLPFDGEKVDLFATGVILFEMVVGHPPFSNATGADFWYRLFVKNNAEYWRKVEVIDGKGTIPREVIALVNRLLNLRPEERGSFEGMKKEAWYKNGDAEGDKNVEEEMIARRCLLDQAKKPE